MTTLKVKHLNRYKDIVWLLFKYGRSDLVREIGQEIDLPEEDREQTFTALQPEELAKDLERLGPTFIKLGQLLSAQADLIPEAYIDALVKFQDHADPFSFPEVEKIFMSELGVRIHDIFQEFDRTPFTAASLAQVHRAVLPSHRVVAVKVQRPHIQVKILEDLEVLEEIASLLERRTDWGKRYGLLTIMNQLRTTIMNELDYKKEALNLLSFKRNLQEFHDLVIPSPIEDYTTSRILTMDLIPGQKITQLDPLVKMDINGEQLAQSLFQAYLKQILIDGLVHVDPHAGNIYLTEDNRLMIFDLGMVAHIPPQMQNGILKLILAVSEGQGEEAADLMIKLGQITEQFNYYQFKNRTAEVVAEFQELSIAQMSMGRLLLRVASIGGESGVLMPPQFNLLGKAFLNLDKVAKALAPHFNPNSAIRDNASNLLSQRVQCDFTQGIFHRTLMEGAEMFQHLPAQLNSIFDILAKNQLKLNVNAIDERQLMSGFEKIANRITLGLIFASLIIGAALLSRVPTTFTLFNYPGISIILFSAAAIGAFILLFNILILDKDHFK